MWRAALPSTAGTAKSTLQVEDAQAWSLLPGEDQDEASAAQHTKMANDSPWNILERIMSLNSSVSLQGQVCDHCLRWGSGKAWARVERNSSCARAPSIFSLSPGRTRTVVAVSHVRLAR